MSFNLSTPEGRQAHAEDLMASIESHRAVLDAIASGATPLFKAGALVGTPTQGQTIASSAFAALMPQDLAPYYYSTIATRAKRIALLTTLKRETVTSVIKERTIKKSHGDQWLISAMSETGIPGTSVSDFEKKISNIRYFAHGRSISHVGQQVNILGGQYPLVRVAGKGGLAMEQESAVEGLAQQMERAYWEGDSAVDALDVDGIFAQIIAGGTTDVNYFDLRGATLDFDQIMTGLAAVTSDLHEGEPSILFVDSKQWKPLTAEAADKNRLDPARAQPTKPGGVYWNSSLKQFMLIGPNGKELELREARLMNNTLAIPAAASGTPQSANLTAANNPLSDVNAASQFAADDAGAYGYKVMAMYRQGNGLPFTVAPITVAAGDAASFEINDDGEKATDNPLVKYAVWRSEKDGTTTYKFIGYFPLNTDGAGSDTQIVDLNDRIPGTYRSAALHLDDGAVTDDVLMDTAQITLAQVARQLPFLACRYSAPAVNMPKKQLMFDNCGVA